MQISLKNFYRAKMGLIQVGVLKKYFLASFDNFLIII